jgi:hypothetical protein
LTAIFVAVICCGCQTVTPSFVSRYMPDPDVQARLGQLDDVALSVAPFDIEPAARPDIECRGQPIRFSRARTIADYVRDAIETELSAAGKYDDAAAVTLSGTVRRAELRFDGRLSTGAIGATWILEIQLNSSNGRSLRATSGRAYRTGFEYISCTEAAKAVMPTVQKLIRTAVTQREFPLLAGS